MMRQKQIWFYAIILMYVTSMYGMDTKDGFLVDIHMADNAGFRELLHQFCQSKIKIHFRRNRFAGWQDFIYQPGNRAFPPGSFYGTSGNNNFHTLLRLKLKYYGKSKYHNDWKICLWTFIFARKYLSFRISVYKRLSVCFKRIFTLDLCFNIEFINSS